MNIYVGNLPFNMTEAEFRETFEAYGEVSSANLIMDRETGRPRGFGFVEMANDTEAQEAIKAAGITGDLREKLEDVAALIVMHREYKSRTQAAAVKGPYTDWSTGNPVPPPTRQ